jgi:soluble lytic murein transglycosylase
MVQTSLAKRSESAMQSLRQTLCLIIVSGMTWSAAASVSPPPQQESLRSAFSAARAGTFSESERLGLKSNPLLPWLDAIQFKQQIAQADNTQALNLIKQHPDDPSSAWLVSQWRAELIKRQDWPAAQAWLEQYPDDSAGSRCAQLLARGPQARNTAWTQNALAIWINEVKPPSHCNDLFAALQQSGALGDTQAWQRFDFLLAENASNAMSEPIAFMTPDAAVLAKSYVAFLSTAADPGLPWPQDSRSGNVASKGLQALARKSPDQAETRLSELQGRFALTAEQRSAVLSEIALWSMVNYLPAGESRYMKVPEAMRSINLREWYLRWNFTQNDDAKTLTAFAQLMPVQNEEPRWRYFKARVLERTGNTADATSLYRKAAQASGYHGWLAADRLNEAYAFCPLEPNLPAKEKAALHRNASLQRALWLWQLGQANYAIWEWNAAFKNLAPEQQREAVAMAQQVGWYDRAVFSLEANEQNQRYYSLRFATPFNDYFNSATRRFNLNRSWLTAHARAESIFMPDVTSSANARGLLQLLPSTAESIARQNGIVWQGPESLYQPDVNILLGAGALRDVIDTFNGKAYLAIGAYNAGPTPVNRWLQARPALDPDFWIETVPFKETREYIPRVLAFSVIFDWRLQQPVLPISRRLIGDFSTPFKAATMKCPAPAPAPATAAPSKPKKRR